MRPELREAVQQLLLAGHHVTVLGSRATIDGKHDLKVTADGKLKLLPRDEDEEFQVNVKRLLEAATCEEPPAPRCPKCGEAGRCVHTRRGWKWVCHDCDTSVGCHRGTMRPLGTMADHELRLARIRAHEALDEVWNRGVLTRTETYKELAAAMGLPRDRCHIGHMGIDDCRRVEVWARGRAHRKED